MQYMNSVGMKNPRGTPVPIVKPRYPLPSPPTPTSFAEDHFCHSKQCRH